MLPTGYKIRNMTREELDIAVSWAANEGWNPGLHDTEVFWQTDAEGFIALEKDGEMIGSGSIVSYNGDFGFMGFFIVKPEYRSKGLGTDLWFYRRDTLLSRLKAVAPIGMDGVFDMQAFYAKGGFVFSHRDLRMESIAIEQEYSDKVVEITPEDFEQINMLDKECFGFDRAQFLNGWLSLPDSRALKYTDEAGLKGFGVIRKCVTGYKIGPLFAADFEGANELFKGLSGYAHGNPIYLDTPEINEDALKLAKMYEMKEMFGCARMYCNGAPKLPYNKIFGVTTFELG